MPDYLPTLAETPEAAIIPGLDERKQRARIAAALLMQGSSGEPIKSWTQGLNRVAQGLIGGYQLGDVRRQGEAEEARTQAILAGLPGLGGAGTPSAAIPQRAAESDSPAPAPAAPAPPSQRVASVDPSLTRINEGFADTKAAIDAGIIDPQGSAFPKTMAALPPSPAAGAALTSPTQPGATPVQTQSIRPPAQVAQAAPPGMASRADVIPPAIQAEIQLGRALAANRPTRDAGLAMYRAALEKAQAWQASQLPTVRDVDPEKPPYVYDPRTQTMKPVPGFATEKPATVMGPKGPIEIPANLSPKERKVFVDNVLQNTADVRSGKLTESQSKDAIFAGRMLGSTRQLTPEIEAEGLSLAGKAASKIPGGLGSYAQNEKRQLYDSLQFQWISGALRKESGAAIQPFEWDRYERTFFPQPGEGPKVIEMKRQARAVADDLMQKGVPVDIEAEVRKRMPELPSAGRPEQRGDEDKKALDWANRNPNDPRAAEIKRRLQVR